MFEYKILPMGSSLNFEYELGDSLDGWDFSMRKVICKSDICCREHQICDTSQKLQRRMPEQEYYQSRRMWHRCFRQSSRTEMHRKWRSPQMDIADSCFTMIMECHLWQCTGNIVLIIWLEGTMTFTGCRCQTLRLMVEL